MCREGIKLTEAELRALEGEVERISQIENSWEPTIENLTEILLAVKEASHGERKQRQADGIANAKKNGVRFGRPRKEPPDDFVYYATKIRDGEMSLNKAAEILFVGNTTLRKWYREWEEERKLFFKTTS